MNTLIFVKDVEPSKIHILKLAKITLNTPAIAPEIIADRMRRLFRAPYMNSEIVDVYNALEQKWLQATKYVINEPGLKPNKTHINNQT